MFTLDQILGLVGTLDDAPGTNTPRDRFRGFLRDSVGEIGAVRDYIEACATNSGAQYDHALQDLVNHTGMLIGFDVEYGRYRGATNDIGHDGLWRWKDFAIVVEVKTTDAFTIKTETLVTYVNKLISAEKLTHWDQAMGLYVFARADSGLKSLANSVVGEKRTRELRIATVDSILQLAELVQDEHITRDEAVALLKPGGVFVADTVDLLARIAAKATDPQTDSLPSPDVPVVSGAAKPVSIPTAVSETAQQAEPQPPTTTPTALPSTERLHVMTPVKDEVDNPAQQTIADLLNAGWYVFGDATPGRKKLKPGDRMCFYESGRGVVAEAEVASVPELKPPATKGIAKNLDKFPWSFRLSNARFFFDEPVVIDADLRAKLDAFADREPAKSWSWFVQGTRLITEHDFAVLTGRGETN